MELTRKGYRNKS